MQRMYEPHICAGLNCLDFGIELAASFVCNVFYKALMPPLAHSIDLLVKVFDLHGLLAYTVCPSLQFYLLYLIDEGIGLGAPEALQFKDND